MKFIHSLIVVMLLLVLSTGCAVQPAAPQTLTVMAAASLKPAFEEMAQTFQKAHAGATVSFNFAGSQALAQQLAQGAMADVFASANAKQMQAAIDAKRVDASAVTVFVTNRLVIITPAANPAGITSAQDLARPGLKLIFAAAEVPAGAYSLKFLEAASGDAAFDPNYQSSVTANIVSYEDNVRAVLTKVSLGEGDAGIVYSSDATDEVNRIEIPQALNPLAEYPIAVVRDAPAAALAQEWLNYVLSDEGQAVLARYGFQPPQP